MSYYEDVYKKRVSFRGNTKKDSILADAEKQFLENLAESPNTEKVSLDGVDTEAIILTNKADQAKLSMYLHTKKDEDVKPGTIVDWGTEEWLIMSSDKNSIPAYNKSLMFRTNVRIKYYNSNGVLNNVPAVFLGSLDSVLREAIYRQMGMAVQLDDRRAMLILPHNIIRTNTRLMIDKRVWMVVDYDSTSNKDLVYLSLQEDNFDAARDDLVNGIADAYVVPQWVITLPHASIGLQETDEYFIQPIVTLDGITQPNAVLTVTSNNENVVIDGKKITAVEQGNSIVTIFLNANPAIKATIDVSVMDIAEETPIYLLVGDDTIRWGDVKTYQLQKIDNSVSTPMAAVFTLTNTSGGTTNLATLKTVNSVTRSVTANENAQVGTVVLHAVYETIEYTKSITIRSLW